MHPVGSIYISYDNQNPNSLFGGEWIRIKDCMLLAVGDTYKEHSAGGSATHKHTTAGHALSVNEMPAHTHNFLVTWQGYSGWPTKTKESYQLTFRQGINEDETTSSIHCKEYQYTGGDSLGSQAFAIKNTGGSASHSHGDTGESSSLPPYTTVYVWRRTA